MTWSVSGMAVATEGVSSDRAELNASRLVRNSQGRLRPRLGEEAVRRRGGRRVRVQRGPDRASGPRLPPRVAHSPQGLRGGRAGLRAEVRPDAVAARLAEHRPARAASRARVLRQSARDPARGGARADARGQRSDFRIQSAFAVGRGARTGLAAAPLPRVREVHRIAAAEGLAVAARLRAERRALRLLRAAILPAAMARALRLHGEGGRALVADLRQRVRRARGEARRRHAPGDAELARQAGTSENAAACHPAGERAARREARAWLRWSGSTPTARARAIPALGAGAQSSGRVGRSASFTAASGRRRTIAWS